MSLPAPGYNAAQMRPHWLAFVERTYGPTRFRAVCGASNWPVYRDGIQRLLAFDAERGELEVLVFQVLGGPATHLGTLELQAEVKAPRKRDKYVPVIKSIQAGHFRAGRRLEITLEGGLT